MAKKLWQISKKVKLNPLVDQFTNSGQILLDQILLPYDIEASKAHVQMLAQVELITKAENSQLQQGLAKLAALVAQGKICMTSEYEDCHTLIETYLTKNLGQVGKKVHTGRSRNDQVLVALKLYIKAELEQVKLLLKDLIHSYIATATKYQGLPLPGYTHMQKAMPSSVSLWLANFGWLLLDDFEVLDSCLKLIDQNPLGSAASFGTTLPLDRPATTKILGFAKTQQNVLSCQNSRTKHELVVLHALLQIMLTLSKCAADILLFTTSEFGYFSLGDSVSTGSSIMPQKKNADCLELIRAKTHTLAGHAQQIAGIGLGLISGYNRDAQETKKPLMEAFAIVKMSIQIMSLHLQELTPQTQKLYASMTADLFATQKTYELVLKNTPFRDAYTQVKQAGSQAKPMAFNQIKPAVKLADQLAATDKLQQAFNQHCR